MRVTFACVLMMLRIVAVSAFLIFVCIFGSTGIATLSDAGYALLGGVAVAVAVYGFGLFMTIWFSRRHGVIPERAPSEPIYEFDVFY